MELEALHFTTLRDHYILHWLPLWIREGPCVLDLGDHVHALNDIAEDDVFAIQVGCPMLRSNDEELAAVCLYLSELLIFCQPEQCLR